MTGTALSSIFDWIDAKLKVIEYGSISFSFTIIDGQVTKVDRVISEPVKIALQSKNK